MIDLALRVFLVGAFAQSAPLLGSWLEKDGKTQVIHFEPARCIFARLGEAASALRGSVAGGRAAQGDRHVSVDRLPQVFFKAERRETSKIR
jgi:hypothetical protein